ncbi:MAG: hypothetical protein ACK4K9_11535 [Bacteroidia bacterium]
MNVLFHIINKYIRRIHLTIVGCILIFYSNGQISFKNNIVLDENQLLIIKDIINGRKISVNKNEIFIPVQNNVIGKYSKKNGKLIKNIIIDSNIIKHVYERTK